MAERIGIYVCECGPNIGDKINIDDVLASVEALNDVVVVKKHRLLCSEEGKKFLKEEIQKEKLSRVVVAACSPKQHELTFMNVCESAGLNPYLFQMTNIREQCAWVTPDKEKATEKAIALIRAALQRVLYHVPLEKKEIESNPDVLIIGAGITGVEASLLLAQPDRKVHLVEKLPSIGGTAIKFEEVFPNMECSPCMLAPRLQEVLQNERINLITLGEVEEVKGLLGNFVVKVKKHARYVDLEKCIGCSACFEPCPVSVKNEFDGGLGERKAIYNLCPGALPNVPSIDNENCLHRENGCTACQDACVFDAINFEDKDEEIELKVGAIVVATGSEEFDPEKAPQYSYGKIDDVYTGLEFARLNASNGPTQGKIVLKNGNIPKSVAIIQSVGEDINEYRSEVSSLYSIKFAHYLKHKLPDVEIFELYNNILLPGKSYQKFYDEAVEKGVKFIQGSDVEIYPNNGKPMVKYKTVTGNTKDVSVDMVILSGIIVPAKDNCKLAEMLDIAQGDEGFFEEEHEKLASVATPIEGVFIAGTCQGPKDITSSVTQALAVSGKILSTLVPGSKLEIEVKTAEIDEELCAGCKLCITLCPYKAIAFDEEKQISVVQDVLCRGCGTCVSGCPSGAITAKHFTYEQISQELAEVLK